MMRRPLIIGIALAGLFCSNYLFIYLYRVSWQKKHPEASSWANDGSFALVGMFGTENLQEELAYAAAVKEASEHFLPYDPFIRENRSLRLLVIDHLTYRFMSLFYLLVGNMQWTWLLLRIFCCTVWFVLIHRLSRKAGLPEDGAVFCGIFVTGFSYLLTFLFVRSLSWEGGLAGAFMHNAWTVMSYGRTESVLRLPRPGLTYAALFLASLLNILAAEKKPLRWALLSGVAGGSLAYVRLDSWSSFLLATWIYAAAVSLKRRRFERGLFLSALLTGVVSLPWLALNYPPDREILMQSGAVFTRRFNLSSFPYLLAFLAAWRFRRDAAGLFLAAMMGSMAVILNVQLVTGYELQPDHWKYFGNIFFFLLAASSLPKRWLARPLPWRISAAVLAGAVFFQSVVYSAINYSFHGLKKDYEDAMAWLETNSEPESVVASLNPEVNYLLPAFTRNKVILATGLTQVSDIPQRENARRLIGALEGLGADKKRFLRENILRRPEEYLNPRNFSHRGEMEKVIFLDRHFILLSPGDAMELIGAAEVETGRFSFRVDYVWLDAHLRDYVRADFPGGARWNLREVYRNPSVVLFRRLK